MKKIILLTPFSLAQNPRLLKEYEALKAVGYEVKVFHGERDKWASNFNHQNRKDFILVGGSFDSIYYFLTRLIYKLVRSFLPQAYSCNRVSWLLYIKAIFFKADLYIGHNLASLPIVVKLAKFHNAKCSFDAEDFHRQESTNDINSKTYQLAKYIEDKYLPQVDYLTTASPLIAKAYQELYPKLKPVIINNVFSSKILQVATLYKQNSELKLFWFSQTIGTNRGLEDVIKAIGKLNNNKISLTLLGSIDSKIKLYLESLASNENMVKSQLIFLPPIYPDEIFKISSYYDIGLASEIDVPLNRDICLTNKIFTYVQAGLAIIASDTTAQKQFMTAYPNMGVVYEKKNSSSLASIIKNYIENKELLAQHQAQSTQYAKEKLNWEVEKEKFLEIIKNTI